MAQFVELALLFILMTVVLLMVIPRKAGARKSTRQKPTPESTKRVQPELCYNDCVRMHGHQKERFCDVACGLSENR
jgi:hypothetical protein